MGTPQLATEMENHGFFQGNGWDSPSWAGVSDLNFHHNKIVVSEPKTRLSQVHQEDLFEVKIKTEWRFDYDRKEKVEQKLFNAEVFIGKIGDRKCSFWKRYWPNEKIQKQAKTKPENIGWEIEGFLGVWWRGNTFDGWFWKRGEWTELKILEIIENQMHS